MSCITKILETKGTQPFLIDKYREISIEGGGTYKGYEYLITFTGCGYRCGYVAVPTNHPTHSSDESCPEFEVHGGITFFAEARFEEFTGGHLCGDKWLGFDAMHGGDVECLDTIKKYFGENDHIIFTKTYDTLIGEMISIGNKRKPIHRTYEYMESECKDLIEQLIAKEAA